MNIDVKSNHFSLSDDDRAFIDKKLQRIHNAENMLVDLIINITKDKDYTADATVNFRWGLSTHVSEQDFDFSKAVDKMIDKLELKITKEKEKVKDRR
jgi:putative sigma-54 modulation protein